MAFWCKAPKTKHQRQDYTKFPKKISKWREILRGTGTEIKIEEGEDWALYFKDWEVVLKVGLWRWRFHDSVYEVWEACQFAC